MRSVSRPSLALRIAMPGGPRHDPPYSIRAAELTAVRPAGTDKLPEPTPDRLNAKGGPTRAGG